MKRAYSFIPGVRQQYGKAVSSKDAESERGEVRDKTIAHKGLGLVRADNVNHI
jgi:hypothetical protein